MRVLGWMLAGALALTAPTPVQAGSLGPGWYPMPNGWDGDWRRAPAPSRQWNGGRFRSVGARIVFPAGGPAVRGQGSLHTGLGVPAAPPSIIRLRIGEARPVAGVIRSRLVLSPSGSGFSRRNEISYRGVKLPRVAAALGRLDLRRGADLPQVGQSLGDLPPVIEPG
jgi:hypothetical protein